MAVIRKGMGHGVLSDDAVCGARVAGSSVTTLASRPAFRTQRKRGVPARCSQSRSSGVALAVRPAVRPAVRVPQTHGTPAPLALQAPEPSRATPEWLPAGWIVALHPSSLDRHGNARVCYIHSLSGKRCLNKQRVLDCHGRFAGA